MTTAPDRLARIARRGVRRVRNRVRRALVGVGTVTAATDVATDRSPAAVAGAEDKVRIPVVGVVETVEPDVVSGWVAAGQVTGPLRVSLQVNGSEIAATWTSHRARRTHWGEARTFAFRVADVWDYLRTDDRLTVRVNGRPLPVSGHGVYVRPAADGSHTSRELLELLAGSHVISHEGRLQVSKDLDTSWQQVVLDLHDRVGAAIKDVLGHDAFLIYGSLLGAVRSKTFIGHDIDLDIAYLSQHRDGPAAAAELRDLGLGLVDRGFDVKCMRTALHIYGDAARKSRIDVFHVYFDAAGEFAMPFGIAGTSTVRIEDWHGLVDAPFADATVLLPANAEQLAEHIYGASWRKPRTDFDWDTDRTRRAREGWTTPEQREEVYWANFYARHEYTRGSTFCELITSRPDTPGTIVDIGCGDGRDALSFAASAHRVVGLDRSDVAVAHATERAAQAQLGELATFLECDVASAEQVRAAVAKARAIAGDEPMMFYLRFFLHSVPAEAQDALLTVLHEQARTGDLLAAEFRTTQDEKLAKVHGGHYRRYQDGAAFGERLATAFGFHTLFAQEGTGLSPYGNEDPHLYRIVARHS